MAFVLREGEPIGERYKLDRLLGSGGMGQVWAAHDAVTNSLVAVKFLKDDRLGADARRRLLKEARASRAIVHPAVVPVKDVVESGAGEPALVMELLRGESLAARIKPMHPVEVAKIILPVAEALTAAHAAGIVHRDVKPDNIFVTETSEVRVLDFGIAKQIQVDAQTARSAGTEAGTILGTPHFMSPEQAFAESDIDHRTDIWSLGLVLYECLSGMLPTQADNLGQVLKIILSSRIPSLIEVAPGTPPSLASLVDKMLERDRDLRVQTMGEVLIALNAVGIEGGSAPAQGVVVRSPDSDSRDAWADTEAPARSTSAVEEDSADSFLRQLAAVPEVMPEPEPDRSGQRISHYAVRQKIGEGGMGIVYAAEDVRLHRKVALKVLPAGFVANADRRRRFLREARSASAVQHANVATVFDVGEAEGNVYIAMEYVEGRTLRALLEAERGKLELSRAIDIATQMAKGLARAHDSGVIHRDIKPENVMIGPDGAVKLLDFGLAKLLRDREEPTDNDPAPDDELASRTGRILGTPAYMSPEQAAGEFVDARTDVYAMGIVLQEMVTGARPKKGGPASRPSIRSSVPSSVVNVLDRCLSVAPDDRYASAGELLQELSTIPDRGLTSAARAGSSRALFGLAGAVAVGAIVWTTLDFASSPGRNNPPSTANSTGDPGIGSTAATALVDSVPSPGATATQAALTQAPASQPSERPPQSKSAIPTNGPRGSARPLPSASAPKAPSSSYVYEER